MAPGSDVATHIEYALLLAGTGRDEEARAVLTPYASGQVVVPAAVRSLGLMDLQSGDLKAAEARFEDLLSTGSQSYESLYYLGVIAERRDDTERAMSFYSRVVSGDHAIAAQQRVARIKADKSGVDAGLAHLRGIRSRPADTRAAGRDGPRGPADLVRRDAPCARSARRRARPVSRTCSTCAWRASLPTSVTARATPRSATCASCSRTARAIRWCRTRSATRSPTRTASSPRREP